MKVDTPHKASNACLERTSLNKLPEIKWTIRWLFFPPHRAFTVGRQWMWRNWELDPLDTPFLPQGVFPCLWSRTAAEEQDWAGEVYWGSQDTDSSRKGQRGSQVQLEATFETPSSHSTSWYIYLFQGYHCKSNIFFFFFIWMTWAIESPVQTV